MRLPLSPKSKQLILLTRHPSPTHTYEYTNADCEQAEPLTTEPW